MRVVTHLRVAVLSIALVAVQACSGGGHAFIGIGSGGGGGGSGFGGDGSGGGGSGGGGSSSGSGATATPEQIHQSPFSLHLWGAQFAGDGSRAVFVGDEDAFGSNPDNGEQLFSIDLASRTLVQLTHEPDLPIILFDDFDVTDNGDRVVFTTNDDLAGRNPDGHLQIYIARTDGSSVTQVTSNDGTQDFGDPEISGDGALVIFLSDSDLTGGNPTGDRHIFAINADGTNLSQVTSGIVFADNVALSDDGSKVAYQNVADTFGANPDHSNEIFVINVDGTNQMQLTESDGHCYEPRISDDGSLIAFYSGADLIAGGNVDGSREIFVARADGTGIVQITASDRDSAFPDISGDGEYVVFQSSADLTGDNPSLQATIFWATSSGTNLTQLVRDDTVPPGITSRRALVPRINNDASLILFLSTATYDQGAPFGDDRLYVFARQ